MNLDSVLPIRLCLILFLTFHQNPNSRVNCLMYKDNEGILWEREHMKVYERITLIITVVSLCMNGVLTGINVFLISQANEISKVNIDFLNMTNNFTSVMIFDHGYAILGEPSEYLSQNGTVEQTTHYGYLRGTLQVITPHFGAINVTLEDFNEHSSSMLNPEKQNQTEISYADGRFNYMFPVVSGLSQINVTLPLKAIVYPNPLNLPPQGETTEVPVGGLLLRMELYDLQTQKTLAYEWVVGIIVTMTSFQ